MQLNKGGSRFNKFAPNVKSLRDFTNLEAQGGDNFSFVDKKALAQNSFSPPPVPNAALLSEQRNVKQLLQGHGSEQRFQGQPNDRIGHADIMQQNFFTPTEQQARSAKQRHAQHSTALNQAQSAKELAIEGNLASQREIKKEGSSNNLGYGGAYDGYY